jgi:hypothetical protein
MSFFDSKEEVINIELTSYGKMLLSKGLLKPAFYSFHDDDVLYDVNYTSQEEIVSKSEVRIQEETPHLKPFYNFVSPKASIEKSIDQELFINTINNLNKYKVDYFDNSLGNSSIHNLYTPAWKIQNLSTKFLSISSSFGDKNLKIPQFECELNTNFVKTTQDKIDTDSKLLNLVSTKMDAVYLQDKTVYFTDTEEIVLMIEEENVDADFDKFDIEVFEVIENNDGTESYSIMKMPKKLSFVDENGLLQNLSFLNNNNGSDTSYSTNYLELLVDKEISQLTVCKNILLSTKQQDSIFNDYTVCEQIDTKYSTNNLYEIINDRATGRNC